MKLVFVSVRVRCWPPSHVLTSYNNNKQTRLTVVSPGQPGFLQVKPGSFRSTEVPPDQHGFLQVNPGSSRSTQVPPGQGFLQVNRGSSRSTRVPPGQPRFLQVNRGSSRSTLVPQVNPGEPAPDQSEIHITHCLHFPPRNKIFWPLVSSHHFYGQCIRCMQIQIL